MYEIIGEATNGNEALELIKQLSPDLIMLDIEMPFLSGLDVIHNIGIDKMPPTIFVTAYSEFAVNAFDLYAVDYLLKPFTKERFQQALEKVEKQVSTDRKSDVKKFLEYLSKAKLSKDENIKIDETSKYIQRITIDSVNPWVVIEITDIEWFSAEDHFVRIYTDKTTYLISEKISELESKLDPALFFRIHRSQIVNLQKIIKSKADKFNTLQLTLQSGKKLKVSRSKREACQIALMKWHQST